MWTWFEAIKKIVGTATTIYKIHPAVLHVESINNEYCVSWNHLYFYLHMIYHPYVIIKNNLAHSSTGHIARHILTHNKFMVHNKTKHILTYNIFMRHNMTKHNLHLYDYKTLGLAMYVCMGRIDYKTTLSNRMPFGTKLLYVLE